MNRGIHYVQPNMKSTYACVNTDYNQSTLLNKYYLQHTSAFTLPLHIVPVSPLQNHLILSFYKRYTLLFIYKTNNSCIYYLHLTKNSQLLSQSQWNILLHFQT